MIENEWMIADHSMHHISYGTTTLRVIGTQAGIENVIARKDLMIIFG